jgi:hypothetical protein
MLKYRIQTFLKSLFWHIYSGFPKSSQTEINRRYNICLTCPSYDNKNLQCLECGCNINNKKKFLNKLAWADQSCPLNKWEKLG